MRILFLLICTLILTSCFEEVDEDIRHVDFNEDQSVLPEPEFLDTIPNYYLSEDAIRIALDSIVAIHLDSVQFYADSVRSTDDTLFLTIEPGSDVEGMLFKIDAPDSVEVIVSKRYETSISIENDGLHCDLTDWKHFTSEWDTLTALNDSLFFRTDTYSMEECKVFPEITLDELRRVVRKKCGRDWRDLLKEAEDPYAYPVQIGITRIYYRISYKPVSKEAENQTIDVQADSTSVDEEGEKEEVKATEKIIVFDVRLGY